MAISKHTTISELFGKHEKARDDSLVVILNQSRIQ